jgi:hypothetical protein
VWHYPGLNSFGKHRDEQLAMHPTVKPVALVADAILDVSIRRGLVLDPFAGSGTTIIAAERTGRRAASASHGFPVHQACPRAAGCRQGAERCHRCGKGCRRRGEIPSTVSRQRNIETAGLLTRQERAW